MQIELDENFESIFICAERYACGRQTYMPKIVQDTIIPLIPKLSNNTISVLYSDLTGPMSNIEGFFGDEQIDKPGWLHLRDLLKTEIIKRDLTICP